MKKLLAGGTLAVLALGGMIATAAPASAHTPSVSADCGFVNVNLEYYSGAKVTVVIDGTTVEDTEFSSGFQGSYDNLALDVAHEWSVTVDAYDGQGGTQYDWADSGSIPACQTPPPAEFASPVMPDAVAGCAASLDDVVLPANTDAIAYSKSELGVVATLTSDAYAFPEELGAYELQEDGTALLPTDLVVLEEDCAAPTPEPSAPVAEPSEEASVAPVAEPSASPSPSAEAPPVLAATGATVGGAIAFAALLAAGGIALVWARKRMQNA